MQVQVEAILLVGLDHIISLQLWVRLHSDSDGLTRLNITYLLQGSWEITHETASVEECSWDLLFTDIVGHICFGVEVREVWKLAVGHCKLSISVHFDPVRQTYHSLLPAWGMVDQMSKETPVALQISAMFFPCVTSISLDIYSQSFGKAISHCEPQESSLQPDRRPTVGHCEDSMRALNSLLERFLVGQVGLDELHTLLGQCLPLGLGGVSSDAADLVLGGQFGIGLNGLNNGASLVASGTEDSDDFRHGGIL